MAAVAVPRPVQRRDGDEISSTSATAATTSSWRPLADALMSANQEDSINLYSLSYSSSSTITDADSEVKINILETETDYAESEFDADVADLDEDPDNIYDALTCDYDIPLTSGTATPTPCATPLRTPNENPLDHARIASAAIAHKLSSLVEPEAGESYALDRLRACCVSCVHGLQALTNALLGDEPKQMADTLDEMVEVPQRPGAQVHFRVHKRMIEVEAETDEYYELCEDYGFDDFE